jgi:hypothetical protein
MMKDNTLEILQQFLIEQDQANDLFHDLTSEPQAEKRRKMLNKYSEMLIKYLEFKKKYV